MPAATPQENDPEESGLDSSVEGLLGEVDGDRLSLADIRAALDTLSAADWERARILAKLRAMGLVDISGNDLLNMAVVALMTSRRWPADVQPLTVLSNVMRSIASNARQRAAGSPVDRGVQLDDLEQLGSGSSAASVRNTPEVVLSAKQRLQQVYDAVAQDDEMSLLLMLWADQTRGQHAQRELGWDDKQYDRVRNRLTRKLKDLNFDRGNK